MAPHLITGHTLLGQLVEVSPHRVPQEVYSLLGLYFKHLWGQTSQPCSAALQDACLVRILGTFQSRTSHAFTCSFSHSSLTFASVFTLCS